MRIFPGVEVIVEEAEWKWKRNGSYLDSRSRTPTGSYKGSYSGSERSRADNR